MVLQLYHFNLPRMSDLATPFEIREYLSSAIQLYNGELNNFPNNSSLLKSIERVNQECIEGIINKTMQQGNKSTIISLQNWNIPFIIEAVLPGIAPLKVKMYPYGNPSNNPRNIGALQIYSQISGEEVFRYESVTSFLLSSDMYLLLENEIAQKMGFTKVSDV